MKIAIDIASLCSTTTFGNYIVTENLIKAVQAYDKKNSYYFYSFCQSPFPIKESKRFIYQNIQPKIFWSSIRTSVEELIKKKDYFFALNQSIPFFTESKIISFSHGLSFYFYPHLYRDSYSQLKWQLDQMASRSEKIIVSSEKVKKELVLVYQNIEAKIVVNPFGIPFDMINGSEARSPKLEARNKFFLAVGMDHPIKNHKILPKSKYKFIVVNNVSRTKLKSLYQKTTALITTSLYESFNLPVLEALAQGCPVIGLQSAIIPELEPYVNIVKDQNELPTLLDNAIQGRLKPVNVKEIRIKFSWKKYVNKLLKFL